MMKTHMIIDIYGFTCCGRNAFDNYLISADLAKDITCKTCKRLIPRAGGRGLASTSASKTMSSVSYTVGGRHKSRRRA